MERRLFLSYGLKITGVLMGGSILSLTSIEKAHSSLLGLGVFNAQPFSPHYAMVVYLDRCAGPDCNDCVEACGVANEVPAYGYRIRAYKREVSPGKNGIRTEYLPVMCNQCRRPPCVRVCPTKATYKNKENGIVMMDRALCIGCKACMTACPYNARYYKYESKSIDKCDFCYQSRLEKGNGTPACVEACRLKAMVFGDLSDENSEVSRLIHVPEQLVMVLRPELGTMPNVFYI